MQRSQVASVYTYIPSHFNCAGARGRLLARGHGGGCIAAVTVGGFDSHVHRVRNKLRKAKERESLTDSAMYTRRVLPSALARGN